MTLEQWPSPEAVIFDWDNTLIDSWPCIHMAINATMKAMDMPQWTLEETHERVGLSMRDAFPTLFGDRWEEARDVFYAAFREAHLDMLVALPSAEALLQHLTDSMQCALVVVSNKTGGFLREEVTALGWDRYFHSLVGAGDAAKDKPALEPVHMALEGLELSPQRHLWCIGDSWVDIALGAAAGANTVLLRPDPPKDEEFDQNPPNEWVKDCKTLLERLKERS
ncbi:MAG: HAD family hydrolase [Rhodospirillaceae bacterium]